MRNYLITLGLTLAGFWLLLSSYSLLNRRELENERMLKEVRMTAFTDKLTGAQSINAYRDREHEINSSIRAGNAAPFAVAVCDINDLKLVNDKTGHQAGDEYICRAYKQLKSAFPDSAVYRVGGDEFVVLLEGDACDERDALLENLKALNRQKRPGGGGHERLAAGQGRIGGKRICKGWYKDVSTEKRNEGRRPAESRKKSVTDRKSGAYADQAADRAAVRKLSDSLHFGAERI